MAQWYDITRSPKYQELNDSEKLQMKQLFFKEHVIPKLDEDESLKGRQEVYDAAFRNFMQTPDDTGQGYVTSMLGSVGRGFGEMVPGAIEGVGALTGIEPVREAGQSVREGLEYISPVNPKYAESIPVRLAGVGGQVGSVLATAGAGGLAGKALAGAGAVGKGAQTAALGSAFLQGAAEGKREAERYGMEGPEAYLRTLAGGVTEAGTELLPFGLASETALAKRLLAGAPKTTGFLGTALSEGGEETLGQIGSNIATKALAPIGAETPGITEGALEAGAYGAFGGGILGGVNVLIPNAPKKPSPSVAAVSSLNDAAKAAAPDDTAQSTAVVDTMQAQMEGLEGAQELPEFEPITPNEPVVQPAVGKPVRAEVAPEEPAITEGEAPVDLTGVFEAPQFEEIRQAPQEGVAGQPEDVNRNLAVIQQAAAIARGEQPSQISPALAGMIPQQPTTTQENASEITSSTPLDQLSNGQESTRLQGGEGMEQSQQGAGSSGESSTEETLTSGFFIANAPMQRGVLTSGKDLQVLNSIIGPDTINVVDNLFPQQGATQMLLHNQPVFQQALASDVNLDVFSRADKTKLADQLSIALRRTHDAISTRRIPKLNAALNTIERNLGEVMRLLALNGFEPQGVSFVPSPEILAPPAAIEGSIASIPRNSETGIANATTNGLSVSNTHKKEIDLNFSKSSGGNRALSPTTGEEEVITPQGTPTPATEGTVAPGGVATPQTWELQQMGATSGEWRTIKTLRSQDEVDTKFKSLPKGATGWRIIPSQTTAAETQTPAPSRQGAGAAGASSSLEGGRSSELPKPSLKTEKESSPEIQETTPQKAERIIGELDQAARGVRTMAYSAAEEREVPVLTRGASVADIQAALVKATAGNDELLNEIAYQLLDNPKAVPKGKLVPTIAAKIHADASTQRNALLETYAEQINGRELKTGDKVSWYDEKDRQLFGVIKRIQNGLASIARGEEAQEKGVLTVPVGELKMDDRDAVASRRRSLDSIVGGSTNAVLGQVTPADGVDGLSYVVNRNEVPGVLNAFVGTSKDFLANPENERLYPALWKAVKSGVIDEGNFYNGRAFVFTDGIGVNDSDRSNARRLGIHPSVAAVRRVLLHESLVHRGIFGLPANLRNEVLGWVRSESTPEDFDILAKDYPRYTNWRNSPEQFAALAEEWLAKKVEKLTRVPTTGPMARLMDILTRIWRWITGNEGDPTIQNLRDVLKLLKAGAEAAEQRLADGSEIKMSYAGARGIENLPKERRQFMRDSLDAAKAMAAAGKSSEEIRAATGWFPGPYDGKMRWEVPDEEATLRLDEYRAGRRDGYKPQEIVRQWFKGKQEERQLAAMDFVKGMPKEELLSFSRSFTDAQKQENASLYEFFAKGDNQDRGRVPLGYILDHARLFETYPWLAWVPVSFDAEDVDLTVFGQTNPDGSIGLNPVPSFADKSEALSTLLHEIQHLIQADEGFAKGSSVERAASRQGWDYYDLSQAVKDYKRTAGEIEARDVQARQNYTPEQRKAIAPYSSENIAPEDAIVLFSNTGVQASISYSSPLDAQLAAAAARVRTMRDNFAPADFAPQKEPSPGGLTEAEAEIKNMLPTDVRGDYQKFDDRAPILWRGETSFPAVKSVKIVGADSSGKSRSIYPSAAISLSNGGVFVKRFRVSDHAQVSETAFRQYDLDYRLTRERGETEKAFDKRILQAAEDDLISAARMAWEDQMKNLRPLVDSNYAAELAQQQTMESQRRAAELQQDDTMRFFRDDSMRPAKFYRNKFGWTFQDGILKDPQGNSLGQFANLDAARFWIRDSYFNPSRASDGTSPQDIRTAIRSAYDRTLVGESSVQVTLEKVFNEAKKEIPTLTEKQFGEQVQNLYNDNAAVLIPADRSSDMLAAGEKWGVFDAMGLPATFVAVIPETSIDEMLSGTNSSAPSFEANEKRSIPTTNLGAFESTGEEGAGKQDAESRRKLASVVKSVLSGAFVSPSAARGVGLSSDQGGTFIPWPDTVSKPATSNGGVSYGRMPVARLKELLRTLQAGVEISRDSRSPLSNASRQDGTQVIRVNPDALASWMLAQKSQENGWKLFANALLEIAQRANPELPDIRSSKISGTPQYTESNKDLRATIQAIINAGDLVDSQARALKDYPAEQHIKQGIEPKVAVAIQAIDDLLASGVPVGDLPAIINSQSYLESLGIENNLDMQQYIAIEALKRVSLEALNTKNRKAKNDLAKSGQKNAEFWRKLGEINNRGAGSRAHLIKHPRYMDMFTELNILATIADQQEKATEQAVENPDKVAADIQKAGEKATDEAAQDVEEDFMDRMLRAGLDLLPANLKQLFEEISDLIADIGILDKIDSDAKSSISAASKRALERQAQFIAMGKEKRANLRQSMPKLLEEKLNKLADALAGKDATTEEKEDTKKRIRKSAEKKVSESGKKKADTPEISAKKEQARKAKADATAQRLIYRTEELFRQGFKNDIRSGQDKPSIYKEFQQQITNPTDLENFAARLAKLKVSRGVAERMFRTAALEKADREKVKFLREGKRLEEIREKQAMQLVYLTEQNLRQSGVKGIQDRTDSENDSVRKAFREQIHAGEEDAALKQPLSIEEFKKRLADLHVRPEVAEIMFKTAERERADIKAMKRYDLLESPDALERMVRKLSSLRPNTVSPLMEMMRWRDIFGESVGTQQDRLDAMQKAIENDESFSYLSNEDKADLISLIQEAWDAKRNEILQSEIKRLTRVYKMKDKAQEAIEGKIPEILQMVNRGVFDVDELRKIVAEKYGFADLTPEQRTRLHEISARLQENIPAHERARLGQELKQLLTDVTKIPFAEIVSTWWVTSILSGFRTAFTIGFGFLSGGFEVIGNALTTISINPTDPNAWTSALESVKRWGASMGAEFNRAWQILFTGDVGLLDPSLSKSAAFLNEGAGKAAGVDVSYKLKKHKNPLVRAAGQWLSFMQNLLLALDSFNANNTKYAMLPLAYYYHRKNLFNPKELESFKDLKAAEDVVIRRDFDGKRPTDALGKARLNAWARNELYEAIGKLQGTVEDMNYAAQQGAMTLDPTGVGGIFYHKVLGLQATLQREAQKYLDDAKRGRLNGEIDPLVARGKEALGYVYQMAAHNFLGALGLKFARFAGNRFNQTLSFLPVLGALRFIEEAPAGDIHKLTIARNQAIGILIAGIGYSMLKAMADEPDDEKRGWGIEGSWANLTPQQKSQRLAEGSREYTIFYNGKSYNYQNWPIGGILAAIGSLGDLIRYSPDKWKEKSVANRLASAAWAAAASVGDSAALSQMAEILGTSMSSRDPIEASMNKMSRVVGNYAGGFVPRFIKDIDLMANPKINTYKTLWERLSKEIPVYRRYEGKALYDIFHKQVAPSRMPWSREIVEQPPELEYKLLGNLNQRGVWLTPANPENRMVGKGRARRSMTQAEADRYTELVGSEYRNFILRYGPRMLQMPTERAKAFMADKTEELRDRALKRIVRSS